MSGTGLERLRIRQISLRFLFALVAISAIFFAAYPLVFPKPAPVFSSEGYSLPRTDELPSCSVYWFRDTNDEIVSGFVAFGDNRPLIMVSDQRGDIQVPSVSAERILIPQDGSLYVLDPMLGLHKTKVKASDVAADWKDYGDWGETVFSKAKGFHWQ